MSIRTKLLLIEDEDVVANFLVTFFTESGGYEVITARDGKEGVDLFCSEKPDVVFTDLRMPVMGGIEVIKAIKEISPQTPIIVISGNGMIKDAVEAIRCGAWDYVEKPVDDLPALERMLRKALEVRLLQDEVAGLKEKLLTRDSYRGEIFESIVTWSPSMTSIFKYVEVVAPTSHPVLITGETGTGKEMFANAVHAASGRSGKFVAINVAGLDDQMLSDCLFGHARGAFTGADGVREGMIARAAGGTLFLDEIGDLKEFSQIKLLRLLQEGEYYPLGSDHPKKSTARIVMATHRDLEGMVEEKTFRQDLYYRLFAHRVSIPPLRERSEDMPLLLENFLAEAAVEMNKKKPTPPPELCGYLQSYNFPGNVRELKALVSNAVTRHSHGVLSMETFLKAIDKGLEQMPLSRAGSQDILLESESGKRMPTLEEAEEMLINQAMALANNNQGIAAGYLGLNRSALNKKLVRKREAETTRQSVQNGRN